MTRSLRRVAGALTAGILAWSVLRHGQASDRENHWAEPPGSQAKAPIARPPRGSTQSRYEAIHVVISSAKSYDRLRADFESLVPRAGFDIFGDLSAEAMERQLKALPDKEGVMILAQSEVGRRQTLLVGHRVRAKHYLVGNPLIASRLIGGHTGAALYVPLRVLIYEADQGRTVIAYDQPSSLLGQFGDEQVQQVARMLDRKLGEITTKAVER